MLQFIKKNFVPILLASFIAILLFVPNAKAYLLKSLLATGVFNASTKKEPGAGNAALVSLSFADKNGNMLNTGDLKGKIIFINFWATWCPPCMAEMGSINALYNKLKHDPRYIFILADADGNLSNASAFMNKYGYSLPVFRATNAVPETLYSGTLPTTLIIDPKGQLVQKHEGIANYDTKTMIEFLRGL